MADNLRKIGKYKISKNTTIFYSIDSNKNYKRGVATYSILGRNEVCTSLSELVSQVLNIPIKGKSGVLHSTQVTKLLSNTLSSKKDHFIIQVVSDNISDTETSLNQIFSDIKQTLINKGNNHE